MNATMTQPTGTIELLDPNLVVLEENIREITPDDLDAGFVESIRQNGVLQPVVGWRDTEGVVRVRYGQRRTVGARVAGVATFPVYVVDIDQADEAARIVAQLVENDQRTDLTAGERVQAWKQLELAGLSVTAIAKRTGSKRADVKTGVTVAKSETGARLVAETGLDLHQAAELLEFEDDQALVDELTAVAVSDPDYFPHAVVQARQDREAQAKREAAEQVEAAKGHRILTEHPGQSLNPAPLYLLRNAEGEPVTADSIQGTAGVAVRVRVWAGQGDVELSYFIDDPEQNGYTFRPGYTNQPEQKGPMTDEQKAERKTLIANNKAWAAAEVVRREWVTKFLARRNMPKDAPAVLASLLGSTSARNVAQGINDGSGLAKEFLGLERGYGEQIAEYAAAHPTKAMHAVVAVVLGGIEDTTDRWNWRNPDERIARYLEVLGGWGYPLSPVEMIAAMIEGNTADVKDDEKVAGEASEISEG